MLQTAGILQLYEITVSYKQLHNLFYSYELSREKNQLIFVRVVTGYQFYVKQFGFYL